MSHNVAAKAVENQDDAIARLVRENEALRNRLSELELLASTDTLTPLFNRRHFMEELERWCWRTHRYGGSYGLLFCDIDRFKAINDLHGHAIGDEVLVGVAQWLSKAVRKTDIVARLGGDEFTVLLDTISEEGLLTKTEAMRNLLVALPVQTAGGTLSISVSVGSALIISGTKSADVLEQADRAMYQHKRSKYPA